MADTDKAHTDLDALFHDARNSPPEVSGALLEAIVTDAARIQDGFASPLPEAPQRPGLWAALGAALGGGLGIGGLVTAGLAGVWIGLAPPAFLPDPAALALNGLSASEPFDGFDMSEFFSEDLQ